MSPNIVSCLLLSTYSQKQACNNSVPAKILIYQTKIFSNDARLFLVIVIVLVIVRTIDTRTFVSNLD